METLNEIADAVYALAQEKGWHDDEVAPGTESWSKAEDAFIERACNNLHDEVCELHEAWRNNNLHQPCDKADGMVAIGVKPLTCLEEELADIVIRVLDNSRRLGIDIQAAIESKHAYNTSRPLRHGGKRS